MKRTGFKKKTYNEVITQLSKKKRTKRLVVRQVGNKKAPKTLTKYRKELWKLFSLYIRQRDNFTCVTCGKQGIGSQIHAGHFITGATCSPLLYFDENNVHAQCYHCNLNLSGNWVRYEEFMHRKYGKDFTEVLKLRRTLEMGIKVSSEWYEEKINETKNLLRVQTEN